MLILVACDVVNRDEARRFAHKVVADVLDAGLSDVHGPDAPAITAALERIVEQHRRFGPKSTDRAPRPPSDRGEPLPFES